MPGPQVEFVGAVEAGGLSQWRGLSGFVVV